MPDPFVPLTLPPGMQNNGTTYQAKGRWHAGNFVRFFQGNIQPIGGWVKRTLTGAPIQGTPSAMVSWTDNMGMPWLAVGTTTGLYVISSTNEVSNITPGAWSNAPGQVWQLTPFGAYLVAVNGYKDPTAVTGNIWVWKGDPAVVAGYAGGTLAGSPVNVDGCFMTAERFLVVLHGEPPQTYPAYPPGYVP